MRAVPRQQVVNPIDGGHGDVNRVDPRLRWHRTYEKQSVCQRVNSLSQIQYRMCSLAQAHGYADADEQRVD